MTARKRNALFIFIVIFGATLWFFLRGSAAVTIDSDEDGLRFSGSAGSVSLAYAEIRDIRYFSAPNYGSAAGGGSKGGFRYGEWESEELGSYTAFLSENISGCILFISEEKTVAFNYESDATTQGFYESIRQLWLGKTGGSQ